VAEKGGQDTKRQTGRKLGRRQVAARGVPGFVALVALLMLSASCVQAPASKVTTDHGLVRAGTDAQAQELAELVDALRPRVQALLPDTSDRAIDVWLDEALSKHAIPGEAGVAALTNLEAGRIRISGEAQGIDVDFLLAHELVHALMGESWAPLPAIMKEGLCDAIACRLVPEAAPLARALRMFGSRFAFGTQELLLSCTEPSFGGRWTTRILISGPEIGRRGPLDVISKGGHGVRLHDEFQDEDVLYGYGLLLVERTIARIGISGLHDLCRRAEDLGAAVVPTEWLLWAADLDAEPETWNRALAEAIGPREFAALTEHLDDGLAVAIVDNARYRFPDFNGQGFLRAADASLQLRGADLVVPLDALQPLGEEVLLAWAARAVPAMSTRELAWHVDGRGPRMGVMVAPESEARGFRIDWMRVEASDDAPDGVGRDFAAMLAAEREAAGNDSAVDVARLRFGADGEGPWLVSALDGGFADYRVEVQGVVVADLEWGLNARLGVDEEGRATVTSRLDPLLALERAVLYDPESNVLISQRALDRPTTEQRFPLRIPFRR
jgi:hypothetical protein